MGKNILFEQLKNGLRKASVLPTMSTLAMGFTKKQVLTFNFKKPRLIWFDAVTKKFYDQGDSTKIKKADWNKINQMNFKNATVLNDLEYYIPINRSIIAESDKPEYKDLKMKVENFKK